MVVDGSCSAAAAKMVVTRVQLFEVELETALGLAARGRSPPLPWTAPWTAVGPPTLGCWPTC